MFRLRNWAVLAVLVVGACAKPDGPEAEQPTTPPAESPAAPGTSSQPAETPAASPVAAGPSWPRFHGAKLDNISAETGLLKEWPAGGPKLLWTAKGLGHGFASVAIAGDTIYTDGNVAERTTITALDLNGKTLWQKENGPAWTRDYPGTRGTPTLEGGRLYHESPLGNVICLDAKTGDKVWQVDLLKEFEGEPPQWGLAESVLLDGDRVICSPGGKKASVVALDKRTGKTVWASRSSGDKAGYASPTIGETQGLRIIFVMNAKALLGVNAQDGELLWRYEHKTEYDVNATMPVYRDGQVFITSGYGTGSELLAIKVEGAKASVQRLWESKDLDNQHGGLVVVDGFIYGSVQNSHNGNWICLDWKTGQMKYAERGVGRGSLTYADGMLYTLGEDRRMGLVPATPNGLKVVSKFTVPSGGEGKSWAHPVVCGGRLYLRHSDHLYAYEIRGAK